jgi:hypothetical protein
VNDGGSMEQTLGRDDVGRGLEGQGKEQDNSPGAASTGSGSHLGSKKLSTVSSLLCAINPADSFSSDNSSPSTSAATMHLIVSGLSRRCFRIGSATLCRSTPGGSRMRRHRIVEMYCVMTSLVSAPGCRRRLTFLSA